MSTGLEGQHLVLVVENCTQGCLDEQKNQNYNDSKKYKREKKWPCKNVSLKLFRDLHLD